MATSKKFNGETLFDLTLFVAVTHASPLAPQENEREPMTHGICGPGYSPPLANYDPDTQSWKMYGDTYLWGDSPLLETLPPSGMTQNGVLFPQPAWEPIIAETESLSWPTPTTQEVEHSDAVLTETGRRLSKDGKTSHSLGLADAVQMWPTPTADDASNVNPKPNRFRGLVASVNETNTAGTHGGKLNPTWVEWLMGFPPGWTDLEDSETP